MLSPRRNNDRLLFVLTYGGKRSLLTMGYAPTLRPGEEQIFVKDENGRVAWRNMDGSLVNTGFVKQQLRHKEVQEALNEARGRPPGAKVPYSFTSAASLAQIEQMEGRPIFGTKGNQYRPSQSKKDITDPSGWM